MHVTTFHLWFVSNSMVDDSIQLRLFPRTLIGIAAKWYIELPCEAINTFGTLAIEFLKNFQLPIRYEIGTKLLNSMHQDKATHISDQIHEWRRRRRLIKAPVLNNLLPNWFFKSLLPTLAKEICLSSAVTEDQSIRRAQHLDLIYSQPRTLHDLLPHAPGNPNPPTT